MTGLAQINGRNRADLDEEIRVSTRIRPRAYLRTDVGILLRTSAR